MTQTDDTDFPSDEVANSGALVAVFGKWPSFHDAEVIALRLEIGDRASTIETDIHVHEMTSEVDDRGYFVLRHHTRVTLRFEGAEVESLEGWHTQNVLFDLEIAMNTKSTRRFQVEFEGITGFAARFSCDRISILSVQPFELHD
jgi:Immunity protein 50